MFVVQVAVDLVKVVAQPDVAVQVTKLILEWSVDISFQSVPQEAGKFVVHSEVTTQVAISKLLNIQAAVVQAFIIKKRPVFNVNVFVFTTAEGRAGVNVIVLVQLIFVISVIVLVNHKLAAVQDINLTVAHKAIQLILEVVVSVVVEPQVAV